MSKKRKIRSSFLKVFESEEGKAVLEELKEFCKWNDCGLAATEALNAYVLGRRSVVCEIMNIIEGKDEEDE